jgi:hypothetical protein
LKLAKRVELGVLPEVFIKIDWLEAGKTLGGFG